MSYDNPGISSEQKDDDVYLKVSLAKYPFLKNQKVGSKGEANFKGEIEESNTHDKDVHHTVCFNDLTNAKAGKRI